MNRPTHRGPRRPRKPVTQISRQQAVDRLAAHLATRDAHLLAIAPQQLAGAARRLAPLTRVVYHLDTGKADVLAVTGTAAPHILAAACRDNPPAAVTVAAIPAADIHRMPGLGITLPAAGHAFSVLSGQGSLLWPVFLLDALKRVDPATYERIIATSLTPPGPGAGRDGG